MASILDIIIQILKIDCGVAQCYYPNEIEAMFYLFFFPTIFIILFIYILTNFIFRGGGKIKGLRMLIAIGAYAFIVFEGLFTLVVSVSHLWWLLTIILIGLIAFIRFLFTGGREKGEGGRLPGIGEGRGLNIFNRIRGQAREAFLKKTGLETRPEEITRKSEEEVKRILNKAKKEGPENLDYEEKVIYLLSKGISLKEGSDVNKLIKTLKEESEN